MRSAAATLTLLAIAIGLATPPARAQHSVSVMWTASTDAAANPSLAYNVYRSPICTGAFAKLNASPLARQAISTRPFFPVRPTATR